MSYAAQYRMRVTGRGSGSPAPAAMAARQASPAPQSRAEHHLSVGAGSSAIADSAAVSSYDSYNGGGSSGVSGSVRSSQQRGNDGRAEDAPAEPPQTVQVCVRIRPPLRALDGGRAELLPRLLLDERASTVQIPGDPDALRAPKAYKFNSVFGPTALATDIYRDVLTAPVESLLCDGHNVAIFAYGQTGSGKTFTMAGAPDSPGIASLVFRHIFAARDTDSTIGTDTAPQSGPTARLSIMEIYKEVVYDLLNNRARVELKTEKVVKATASFGGSGSSLRFVNLDEYPVYTQEEAMQLMARGMDGKTMGPNYEHEHSSRSHTVVRLVVGGSGGRPLASLMLVDLAGSEAAHDNSSPRATSEGRAIGKSLFQLRQCVHALGAGKRPDYRVSKLTRLLEPALTRGFVSVICTTGVAVTNFRQVADTLEFGMQAQVVQLNPTAAASGEISQELDRLRAALHASEERNHTLERDLKSLRAGNEDSDVVQRLRARLLRAEQHAAQVQQQLQEANGIKDMMEQQLLALMESGGSTEAALRRERQHRAEAEASVLAMESQYETAVFALNERESGAVTESMLQRQKQLRAHVREVEQALRERQEDERAREEAMHTIQQQNETLHRELQHACKALAELRAKVAGGGTSAVASPSRRDALRPTRQEFQSVANDWQGQGELDEVRRQLSQISERPKGARQSLDLSDVEQLITRLESNILGT